MIKSPIISWYYNKKTETNGLEVFTVGYTNIESADYDAPTGVDIVVCEEILSEQHAKLIAAAPELLEALQWIAEYGDNKYDIVDRAIAKAIN